MCETRCVMGILNVTDDSFYAGSRCFTEEEISARASQILAEGGRMIDVGACSTRPGSVPVGEEVEMERLRRALPLIRHEHPDAILSVDTFRPRVAQVCAEEYGVSIINDVSEGSEEMFMVMGTIDATYILMSTQPTLEATKETFRAKIELLHRCGCRDIWLDPGYGFGKDLTQNYAILCRQEELLTFGLPLLAGVSRKRLVWQLLGSEPDAALNGTTVVNTLCLLHGAQVLRVHDVREAVEAIKIVETCSSILAY